MHTGYFLMSFEYIYFSDFEQTITDWRFGILSKEIDFYLFLFYMKPPATVYNPEAAIRNAPKTQCVITCQKSEKNMLK